MFAQAVEAQRGQEAFSKALADQEVATGLLGTELWALADKFGEDAYEALLQLALVPDSGVRVPHAEVGRSKGAAQASAAHAAVATTRGREVAAAMIEMSALLKAWPMDGKTGYPACELPKPASGQRPYLELAAFLQAHKETAWRLVAEAAPAQRESALHRAVFLANAVHGKAAHTATLLRILGWALAQPVVQERLGEHAAQKSESLKKAAPLLNLAHVQSPAGIMLHRALSFAEKKEHIFGLAGRSANTYAELDFADPAVEQLIRQHRDFPPAERSPAAALLDWCDQCAALASRFRRDGGPDVDQVIKCLAENAAENAERKRPEDRLLADYTRALCGAEFPAVLAELVPDSRPFLAVYA